MRNSLLTKNVSKIIKKVRNKGDQALFAYTKKWDHCELDSLIVSAEEIRQAYQQVTPKSINLVKSIIQRIHDYHSLNKPHDTVVDSKDGVFCHKVFKAIDSVGLYVPGGSAPLISTLIMLAIPAKVAGCRKVSVCTPVSKVDNKAVIHSLLLATADLCKVDMIYKLGGAQAVAAMAYGTESITKVNKIYGPGNSWVTKAKMLIANDMDGAAIDMPAGPSEVMVIADCNANFTFIAADLLAQAEHGADSQVILITDNEDLAKRVKIEVETRAQTLPRHTIITQSLKHSAILIVDCLDDAMMLANEYAPEHLIIQCEEAQVYTQKITAAGAVFVGRWAAEALGDYVTGSNHVLPTYGYAKSFSGLSTIDFMKALSIQYVDEKGIATIGGLAMELAEIEGLMAHKLAVETRLNVLRGKNV